MRFSVGGGDHTNEGRVPANEKNRRLAEASLSVSAFPTGQPKRGGESSSDKISNSVRGVTAGCMGTDGAWPRSRGAVSMIRKKEEQGSMAEGPGRGGSSRYP